MSRVSWFVSRLMCSLARAHRRRWRPSKRPRRSRLSLLPLLMRLEAGLSPALARPGGNVTGLTFIGPEVVAKHLQLLKQAVPGVTRVAVLWQSGGPGGLPERTQ